MKQYSVEELNTMTPAELAHHETHCGNCGAEIERMLGVAAVNPLCEPCWEKAWADYQTREQKEAIQ